jgi:hypothetical protein
MGLFTLAGPTGSGVGSTGPLVGEIIEISHIFSVTSFNDDPVKKHTLIFGIDSFSWSN